MEHVNTIFSIVIIMDEGTKVKTFTLEPGPECDAAKAAFDLAPILHFGYADTWECKVCHYRGTPYDVRHHQCMGGGHA